MSALVGILLDLLLKVFGFWLDNAKPVKENVYVTKKPDSLKPSDGAVLKSLGVQSKT